MKTAIPKERPFSAQSSRLPEPAEPQEIVVYHWGRIFAALFVLFLVVGGTIWGAFEIFGTGEQKEALVEHQSVEAPSLPSVYIDQPASEPASIQLPNTAAREKPEVAEPTAGESEPSPEDATSIKLLSDHLIRAQLSTGLEEKEPIDEIPNVLRMDSDGLIRIYLFTEIQGMEGQLHFHDWYLEDERIARVGIRPSVDPMRASSAKYIDRHMLGDWRVEVVTEKGELLAKGAFSVLPQ
ncbi:DUF2914 domain-containing protein [Marinobacter sp. HN1S83]|uniref:DUF2914 domain-containing protein n=1 Tax=Marinobacter sp. HN1S83 TaxID=3382301 RepID=UPI00387AC1DC